MTGTENDTPARRGGLVVFNGLELDVDIMELNGWELSQIKQKAGFGYRQLVAALMEWDGDAIRAVFWIAERRHRPDLQFGDYHGPTLGFAMEHAASFTPQVPDDEDGDELGKAAGATTPTTETPGSPSSPTDSGGPDASTTT